MVAHYNDRGYVVHIAQGALIDLCLAAMEAHVVEERRVARGRNGRNRLETFGLLWGGASTMADGRTLLDLRKGSVDTTAIRGPASVLPSKTAFLLKKDLMTSFWPEHQFIGDFHTHTYDESDYAVADIDEKRLYEFTPEDYDSIVGSPARRRFWANHGYRLGLVATLVKMKRAPRTLKRNHPTRLSFNLGKYRVWLKAYVGFLVEGELQLSGHNDRGVMLYCPWVSGFQGPLTPFGGENGRSEYVPGQLAEEVV